MASRANITPSPPSETKEDNPVRMSQMANSRKPIFLFIKISFL
jgi:hypothetical protein